MGPESRKEAPNVFLDSGLALMRVEDSRERVYARAPRNDNGAVSARRLRLPGLPAAR